MTPTVDEVDLQILGALQVDPRVPWSLVGEALDIDPVTASRRWSRLQSRGQAWTTASMNVIDARSTAVAYVEFACAPNRSTAVAAALAELPGALTVKQVTGGREIVAVVVARDLARLSGQLLDELGSFDGVRSTRSHLLTGSATEGSRWRLGSLSKAQQELLKAQLPAADSSPWSARELDYLLQRELSQDGRASLGELAAGTGTAIGTVRRRLNELRACGTLRLRCDFNRQISGFPIGAVFFANVPSALFDETARRLALVPEVRTCLYASGSFNLLMDVWLRSLPDVRTFESYLATRLPRLEIVDRSVVLRTVKHLGRILDADGNSIRAVPIDL